MITDPLLQTKVNRLLTDPAVDFHGRRIANAGDSVDSQDYVTRNELLTATNTSSILSTIKSYINSLKLYVISKLAPVVDSSSAILITKADQATKVVVVDTTNRFIGLTNVPTSRFDIEGDAQNNFQASHTTVTINDTDAANSGTLGGRKLRIWNARNNGRLSQNLSTDGTNWNLDNTSTSGLLISYGNLAYSISFATAGANPRTIGVQFAVTPTAIGFWGSTATKQTLAGYVSNSQGVSYSGIASGVVGTPYAQVNDLNALRTAYENLRVMCEDLRTKLQNTTLVG